MCLPCCDLRMLDTRCCPVFAPLDTLGHTSIAKFHLKIRCSNMLVCNMHYSFLCEQSTPRSIESDSTSKDSPVAFAKKADLLVRKPAAEERQLLLLLELYAGALSSSMLPPPPSSACALLLRHCSVAPLCHQNSRRRPPAAGWRGGGDHLPP